MTSAPRTVLFLLLATMQAISPWVHAHTGEERGGFLHLPGLEFLVRGDRDALSADARADRGDLIVAIQAGVRHGAEAAHPWPGDSDQPSIQPVPRPPAPPPTGLSPPYLNAPPPLFQLVFRDAKPRAPPLISSCR